MANAARDTFRKSRAKHGGGEDGIGGCKAGTDDKCG